MQYISFRLEQVVLAAALMISMSKYVIHTFLKPGSQSEDLSNTGRVTGKVPSDS